MIQVIGILDYKGIDWVRNQGLQIHCSLEIAALRTNANSSDFSPLPTNEKKSLIQQLMMIDFGIKVGVRVIEMRDEKGRNLGNSNYNWN